MKKTKKSGRRDPLFQGEQLEVLSAKFHAPLAICCCGILPLSRDRCIEKVSTTFAHSLVHDLHELQSLSRNRKCGACGVARASLGLPSHQFLRYQLQSFSAAISILYIHGISGLPHCRHCRRVMDPLSIAAAVSGFLSLAGQIAATLKDYVDGVQSAPDEVQSLLLEVTALCQVLKDLLGFLQKDDLNGRRFESSSVLCIAVKACQYQLEELRGKLADLSEACSSKKLPGWVTRMKWPLKKDELQQTVVALQRFAQIFQFSMVIQNWYV
jgi:hypothetical protein